MAANLGLKAVARAARELEAACAADPESPGVEQALSSLGSQLAPVLDGLDDLDDGGPPQAAATVDRATIAVEMQRLRQLVEDSDTEAGAVLEGLTAMAGSVPYDVSLKRLRKALDAFDFDAADGMDDYSGPFRSRVSLDDLAAKQTELFLDGYLASTSEDHTRGNA